MRYERSEDRERQVDNEPAVRGPIAQETAHEEEVNRDGSDEPHARSTRRGSSSERSER
jgi:hypothetical protein